MRNVSIRAVLFALPVLLMSLAMSSASFGQVGISVRFGPPPLPVYEQPICPGEGYIWTPGYWAWGDDDYYWVPGTWVEAPEVGYLWTPPFWGWEGGAFLFHAGYWGPHVGFYGGIDYGFGYSGDGFEGGRWDNGRFFYNRSVTNINVVNIHNVYNTTVIHRNVTRVSYNGGEGGITARPTARDEEFAHERHIEPVRAQIQHREDAQQNRELRASANHGKPPIAATDRPTDFHTNIVKAREAGGAYNPPANRGANEPRAGEPHGNEPRGNEPGANQPRANEPAAGNPVRHPNDLPKMDRPAAPNTGNEKMDKKYQQQQDKLQQQQDKERQKLQQHQDREHQQLEKQKANEGRTQQVEQKHQQQTEKLQQRQTQQEQKLQQKEKPRGDPKEPKR